MSARYSLIETVRVRAGSAPLWPLHLQRLARSCTALGLPFPGTLDVPGGGEDRIHRLEVGARGVSVSSRAVGPVTPVRLAIATQTHWAYSHKTTERAQFDRALEEALTAGADDAILLTPSGEVAESAIWGLFWWEGGCLCGPPLDFGILPGVARARLAHLAGSLVEGRRAPDEIVRRGCFVANAGRGVVAVASIGGRPVLSAPETRDLAARFWG